MTPVSTQRARCGHNDGAMFCPTCNSPLYLFHGHIVSEHMTAFSRVISCTGCSLVSEVGSDDMLVDIGPVMLEDLEEPHIPGINELPALGHRADLLTMFSGTTSLRRSES